MKYTLALSATMGFALLSPSVKEQWGAAQRRTSVTPFLGKGDRGMAGNLDEENFQ